MKIIDFECKGNAVRFYLGKDDCEDYTGDDWNDRPYDGNAGRVRDEYIVGHRDVLFPFGYCVLEPKMPEWRNHAEEWSKDDMKARKVPCIIAIPDADEDYYGVDDFDHYVAAKDTVRFYFGDQMEPGEGIYE